MSTFFAKWWRPVAAVMVLAVSIPVLTVLAAGLWSSTRSSVEQSRAAATPAPTGMTRESCVDDKLRQQPKLYIHDMFRVTNECELAIQSNEALELRRRDWQARQNASRQAEPAASASTTPAPSTTSQRVWR